MRRPQPGSAAVRASGDGFGSAPFLLRVDRGLQAQGQVADGRWDGFGGDGLEQRVGGTRERPIGLSAGVVIMLHERSTRNSTH